MFHRIPWKDQAYRCQRCSFNLCSVCVANGDTLYDELSHHEGEETMPKHSTIQSVYFSVCEMKIIGFWFECEQCTGVHICEDDRPFLSHCTARPESSLSNPRDEQSAVAQEEARRAEVARAASDTPALPCTYRRRRQ